MKKLFYTILGGVMLLQSLNVWAGEATGSVDTGASSGPEGTVISAPTASPAAGTYTSTQSVTLSASGAPYLCYTTNGSVPACDWDNLTCATGTKYSTAISIASSQTIKALSCYQGAQSSSVSSFTYTISVPTTSSSSGGGGGGGGGGGSSGPDTTTPYVLSTFNSTTTVFLVRPLDLQKTDGILTRPVEVKAYLHDYALFFEAGTEVTTCSGGTAFSGTVAVPAYVSTKDCPAVPETYEVIKAIQTGGSEGEDLCFSQPVKLTIPFSLDDDQELENVGLYYYDSEQGEYVRLEAEISEDGKSIMAFINHSGLFAVFYQNAETGKEVATELGEDLPFEDIASHWAKDYILKLEEHKIVEGQKTGIYAPDVSINRAEFVTIMARAFAWNVPEEATVTNFSDVKLTDWFAPYVQVAVEKGIIEGNEINGQKVFRPSDKINRAEAMKVVLLAAGVEDLIDTDSGFDDIPVNAWFAPYVTYAKKHGIVSGKSDGIFAPEESLTRAEIAKILVLLLGL